MKQESVQDTLREYGRGIAGGLLFSLPLLYTMEVWWRGFTADPLYHLIFVISTLLILFGYNNFAGLRKDANFKEVVWDSFEELGLALVVSFAFLLLIGKISFGMSVYEIIGKVIVESMMVAIGISIGTAQLGKEKEGSQENEDNKESKNLNLGKILVLSICGAVMVSSSVAPTEEILLIAVESSTLHLILMILVSLIIGAIVLFYSNFINTEHKSQKSYNVTLEVMVSYLAALFVSFAFLLYFGRFSGQGIYIIIAQIIVLGIPATLGASAARLLIGGK